MSDILPPIRERGVRAGLAFAGAQGRPSYGVVAGRRRWFSLKAVAKEAGAVAAVPCIIMEAGDEAEALEASLIENTAPLDPDEMEQFAAFKRLVDKGPTSGPQLPATEPNRCKIVFEMCAVHERPCKRLYWYKPL